MSLSRYVIHHSRCSLGSGSNERFNGTLPNDLLSGEDFAHLYTPKVLSESYREEWNTEWIYGSLDYHTQAEYSANDASKSAISAWHPSNIHPGIENRLSERPNRPPDSMLNKAKVMLNKAKVRLKELVRWFTYHESRENDVYLLTSRRSGGTWLQEIIASNDSVRPVYQPMSDVLIENPWLVEEYFPEIRRNWLVPVIQRDEQGVKRYLDDLKNQHITLGTPWNVTDDSFSFQTTRLCIKLHNIKHWIKWIEKNTNGSIIFHFRHPIPVSISVMRRGWSHSPQSYLEDEMVKSALGYENKKIVSKVIHEGSELEKKVVHWVVENIVPIRTLSSTTRATYLSYEEMVINPKKSISLIASALDLPCAKKNGKKYL